MAGTTAPPTRATTMKIKPNSYDDQSLGDIGFGSQAAASSKFDNIYRVPAPQNILDEYHTRPQYTYPHNVASYVNTFNNFGKGGAYTKMQIEYTTTTPREKLMVDDSYEGEAPLTGPMVVKVYPDGRPVKAGIPLPQDEDLRQYKLSKLKLPNY